MTADATEIDSRATPAPSYYRPDVQGLRAVAVLMVVAYHAGGYLPGGFVGVDVFFVISGFVIGQLLHRELEATGTIDFKRFYLRRIRRILPASAVLLAVVLPLSAILAPIGGLDGTQRTGFTAAFFNANTYLMYWGGTGGGYFDASAESNALLHMWSLAVEEQFYLVFPFILWASWKAFKSKGISAKAVRYSLVSVAIVSFGLSWILVTEIVDPLGVGSQIAFYSAPTRAWQFAVGALLAMGVGSWLHRTAQARLASAIAGLALVAYSGVFYDAGTAFPGIAALAPTIGTALLIGAATANTTNPMSKLLATKPMQTIGDISYSWYLWHWPIIVFAVAYNQTDEWVPLAAAAVSILPAIASQRFIENPIRHASSTTTTRTLGLGAACIIIPLAASALLYLVTPTVTNSETARAYEPHLGQGRGCDSTEPLGGRLTEVCTWRVQDPVGTALLIGDSNAGHFSEGFVSAASQLNMNAVVRTSSGCAFVDIALLRDGVEQTACQEFVTRSIAALAQLEPSVVVVSSASDLRVKGGDGEEILLDNGSITTGASERLSAWGPALQSTLEAMLASTAKKVYLVHPVPRVANPGKAPDASWLSLGRSFTGNRRVTKAEAQSLRNDVVSAERLATQRSGATPIDLFDLICGAEVCELSRNGAPVYRDRSHISVSESLRLTEVWLTYLGAN